MSRGTGDFFLVDVELCKTTGFPATLQASAGVPPFVGKLVSVEWDVHGIGSCFEENSGSPKQELV